MSGGASALIAALTLSGGHNTAVVTLGAAMLGLAAGAAGTFLVLRKRALISDAAGHATLPGLALGFLILASLDGDGRWLPGLLAGAALSAAAGLWAVDRLATRTRLSEDAAIGAVLSAFFGAGVVLMGVARSAGIGRPAGLEGFVLGSTAGMSAAEAWTVATLAAAVIAALLALRRPLTLICFDAGYAASLGLPVRTLDRALLGLGLAVTVAGVKLVGLVLIVALLIIPPVAARFWTDRVEVMAALAAVIGAVSGYVGAAISASGPHIPTGPAVVLTAFSIFAVSLLAAPRRGAVARWLAARSSGGRGAPA